MVDKRQTPKETKDRIIALYESGVSRQEIQYDTGVSQPTIRKVLTEAGYPPNEIKPARPITAEERAEIIRLFNLGNKAVSAMMFIEVWQTSETLPEAAYRLGMSTVSAYQRAAKYKARGVKLKKMPTRPDYRWDELNDFAQLFNTDESE